MKQANRYRPSKDKEVELAEWMENRIAMLRIKQNDRRKMDRWMRKVLVSDTMKKVVMEWRAKLTTDENPYIFKPQGDV